MLLNKKKKGSHMQKHFKAHCSDVMMSVLPRAFQTKEEHGA